MSEHQYYEFVAVDRPLTTAERAELRDISTRADISATRFVNVYNYGDFRGDPAALMTRFFDLHVYLANWGTRRLMMRLPRRVVDESAFVASLDFCESASAAVAGDHLVLSFQYNGEDGDWNDTEGEDAWLPKLAPLRDAALEGDTRLVYLAWLIEASGGDLDEADVEPLDGLGPLDRSIEAFAAFFHVDVDLLAAAAERVGREPGPPRDPAAEIGQLSTDEKGAWLARLYANEAGLGAALRARLRPRPVPAPAGSGEPRRTLAALLARAEVLAVERRAAEQRAADDARHRAAAEEERKRKARLVALKSRGEGAWREVEGEIERRAAPGYERAAALLADLRALAERDGAVAAYDTRLAALRARHDAKRTFIARLDRVSPPRRHGS